MSTITVENFLSGKTLIIPNYQRDYAWTIENVNDLFGDVEEALEVDNGHYLGTFILSQSGQKADAYVVDGQQRLTTLTMLLSALISGVEDNHIRQHYRNTFIEHPLTGLKLRMQSDNAAFFQRLLANDAPEPKSDGQDRLAQAYQWIRQRIHHLLQQGGQDLITRWLVCVSQMEVLEFIERNEGKAIRMFQSVNDRGVPLAKMDIVKSLLIYYSNRFLDASLDDTIAQAFGYAFRSFSRIKRLAGKDDGYKVRLIARDTFREDDVLRYHYLAFDGLAYGAIAAADYNATAETVLEGFLKPSLRKLRNDPAKLSAFITGYTSDLSGFFATLEDLIGATREDTGIYRLFVVQDLAATLYPLVIRIQLMGWLSQTDVNHDGYTLRDLIGMADLRVFKLRGTNPQADVAWITHDLPKVTIDEVGSRLRKFSQKFMPDSLMASRLADEDMYRNPGLPIMLLEAEESARRAVGLPELKFGELVKLNAGLSVEHILPQEPSFNISAYGFADAEEYQQHVHRIGNLISLESWLNSKCNNRTIEEKMLSIELYPESQLTAIAELRAECADQVPMFTRDKITSRSKALAGMVVKRWPGN
nr:DUF262 domain-containing protein [uncultured Rhodopila sp.]